MSTLNVSNITDGTDTVETGYVVNGSAKAWVNFNGTGTIAIRDSFNVGSLTDSAAGDYEVNLSSSMSAADYTANGTCGGTTGAGERTRLLTTTDMAVGSLGLVICTSSSGARPDPPYVHLTIHGDLA